MARYQKSFLQNTGLLSSNFWPACSMLLTTEAAVPTVKAVAAAQVKSIVV